MVRCVHRAFNLSNFLVKESPAIFALLKPSGAVWEEKRGAGIQLSINHLKPAKLGDLVHAAASPINVGNNNQSPQQVVSELDHSSRNVVVEQLRCVGRNDQNPAVVSSEGVWEVRLWKVDPSNSQIKSMVSSSTVTIACNMPVPDHAKPAGEILKMFAKL
ncbi:DHNAT1 [Citrus sinensis]|uniref:DHNAT1 n=1 Tax=Citrus sinensis TaxID=2711 RepID=A0ACB8IAM2_CITSI|nr:DHNAT1 [Citrus sinensis]